MNNRQYPNLFNILKNSPQTEKILKNIKSQKKFTKKYYKILNMDSSGLNYYIIIIKKSQLKKRDKIYFIIKNFKTIQPS